MFNMNKIRWKMNAAAHVGGRKLAFSIAALAILPVAIIGAFWLASSAKASRLAILRFEQKERDWQMQQDTLRRQFSYRREVGMLAERLERLDLYSR